MTAIQAPPPTGNTRRSFLAKLGLGGLMASASIFGTSTAAAAAGPGCCDLAYNPPNKTMTQCRNAACEYIWYCSVSSLRCTCCELNYCDGGNYGSAYSCVA